MNELHQVWIYRRRDCTWVLAWVHKSEMPDLPPPGCHKEI